MAAIETSGLTKFYGKSRGIIDLSLSINEGELFGYLGPNGAGKTTTIRCLLGLISPTEGSASIFGMDIVQDSAAIRSRTGYVSGDPYFYPKMTGRETINYVARLRPGHAPVLKDSLIKRLDFDVGKRCKDYSRGNRQKLAIVLGLMHDPDLLILDEPTLGLDPIMQKEVYEVLKDFRSRGKTVFLSSHILSDVDKTCERVGVIKEGKLVTVENVSKLESKKVHSVRATFADAYRKGDFKLPGVTIVEANDRSIELKVTGEINPVIKALGKSTLVDLAFEHASLEDVFLEFYGEKV